MSVPPPRGTGPRPPHAPAAPPRPLLQAHQEMLLKSLLAAPGSFAKTVPLLSAAGATQVQQIFASFFFSSPSSCPVAIKRPVYYETWPPCHCCYWLCGSQPQAPGTYRPKALPSAAVPLSAPPPPRAPGPERSRGHLRPHGEWAAPPAASGGSGFAGRARRAPRNSPPSPVQDGPPHCTKEKKFFSFPNLKSTSRKIPQEVLLGPRWAWHAAAFCL